MYVSVLGQPSRKMYIFHALSKWLIQLACLKKKDMHPMNVELEK